MNNTALEDMEVLKEIINKNISLSDVDLETKKRLIVLCNNREKQIREKINKYKNTLN